MKKKLFEKTAKLEDLEAIENAHSVIIAETDKKERQMKIDEELCKRAWKMQRIMKEKQRRIENSFN
jgi:uncharacterized protein YPO0396